MIHTAWPYLALMLLVAGFFPALERRFGWRIFNVLPPIVFTYLFVTALAVGSISGWLALSLPTSSMISATTWTILLATGAGLVVAHTPLARFPGASTISGALLISVVAVLASQSNFEGIAAAPLYLLCGVTIIAIHAVLLVGAAKLFRFDLYLCGISSLAHIGGVAATPVLAASYSAALVPVGILLALLGYILGTGFGLLVATVMSTLAGS